MNPQHINMASDISELAQALEFYKSGLPEHLRASAINCSREMHKFAQELALEGGVKSPEGGWE